MPFGTLVKWNADRGFGFITPDDRARTGGDVFVHISELRRSGIEDAEVGDAFSYELAKRPDGKIVAAGLLRMERVRR